MPRGIFFIKVATPEQKQKQEIMDPLHFVRGWLIWDDNSCCGDDESPKNFLHLRALNFKPLKELIMRQYIIAERIR